MESHSPLLDTSRVAPRAGPRPVYSRTRSHQGLLSNDSTGAADYSTGPKDHQYRHHHVKTSAALPARSYGEHAGTTSLETAAGTGLETAPLRGSSRHSSTTHLPQRKASYSRSDVEFWASLYAQHPVYTRQGSDNSSDLPLPTTTFSPSSRNQCHAQVKIWQVLTKTDLPDHRHSTASSSSSSKRHGRRHENRFQFERLPIKAPQSSSKTATLSSNGQPFSIVFFFTIESTAPAVSKPKSKSKSSSRSKAAPPEPTTLWYQETAFTRVRTTHERTELMGTFFPNGTSTATEGQQGSSPSSPPTSSPLYIYETQKLDIEHPRDDDDTLLLDLKLMGPEGSVYAEFSYTFVRENNYEKSRSKAVDEKHDHSSKSKVKERRSHTMSPMPPRPEKDMPSPRKDRFEHDELEDDYDEAMRMVSSKGSGAEAVAEEPDAGEHFMQATSQFFSKMG